MVVIRLSLDGKKKYPINHIVVANKKMARDSRIETIGYFNRFQKELKIQTERYLYWLSKGAQVSNRAKKLFKMWVEKNPETVSQSTK